MSWIPDDVWDASASDDIPTDFDYRGYALDVAEDGSETLCELTVAAGVSYCRFVVLSGETR